MGQQCIKQTLPFLMTIPLIQSYRHRSMYHPQGMGFAVKGNRYLPHQIARDASEEKMVVDVVALHAFVSQKLLQALNKKTCF